jgi:hypothetical protein
MTVSAQAPKEDFQPPMTPYTVGAQLDFWAALQVTFVDTVSEKPQKTNMGRYEPIFGYKTVS